MQVLEASPTPLIPSDLSLPNAWQAYLDTESICGSSLLQERYVYHERDQIKGAHTLSSAGMRGILCACAGENACEDE